MQGFADFADALLGGALLFALSLAVGGIAWTLAVLRPRTFDASATAIRRALNLTAVGATGLALTQAAILGVKALLLLGDVGPSALGSFAGTLQCRAGTARALAAVALAGSALALRARPASTARLALVGVLSALVTVTGAWLVHAAGRLDARVPLMVVTVLHQLAAAVWLGGLVQLAGLWALARHDPAVAARWPVFVARFSHTALVAVAVLLAASLPLGVHYVGSFDGLVGTGYGSLVVTKAVLTAMTLLLAAANLRAARAGERGAADGAAVRRRLPHLAEAEIILAVALLFVAAGLSAQPPPVDGAGERATLPELVEVFRPKWPALQTPSVAAKLVDAATPGGLVPERSMLAYSWSNYSHNVAGLFLLAMGAIALSRWRRHAPLALVALAVFVFLRTSASEGTWPFGTAGILENALGNAEALQHRIGAALALALGLVEWRARAAGAPRPALRYAFPVLAAVGGVVLLTHSHTPFEPKSDYLIQVTHTAMGTLAVLMGVGRWLELRTQSPLGRAGGAASAVAMVLLALVLVFYREANVVVPGE